jgi:hypothetical protein
VTIRDSWRRRAAESRRVRPARTARSAQAAGLSSLHGDCRAAASAVSAPSRPSDAVGHRRGRLSCGRSDRHRLDRQLNRAVHVGPELEGRPRETVVKILADRLPVPPARTPLETVEFKGRAGHYVCEISAAGH